MVLAGGFGTRIKSEIGNVPKALAPVEGVPFLEMQIEHWLRQGLRDFAFLLHHQADQVVDFLYAQQKRQLSGCKVRYLIEPMPFDTGGAVAFAVKKWGLTDNFLVTNADTWLGGGMVQMFESTPPAIGVVNQSEIGRFGQVYLNSEDYVTAFLEKNAKGGEGWVYAGLCHLPARLFKDWSGQAFSLERDLFSTCVRDERLKAVKLKADFVDIGIPADYHRYCQWIKAGRHFQL